MELEIRKVGVKKKYYLAHSYRNGSKVGKIRIFLGTDVPNGDLKAKIDVAQAELAQKVLALKAVEDPYSKVLSTEEVKRLRTLESKGGIRLEHLSEENWMKFTEVFTYDTNAIEGSTVLRREVRGILGKNKWPGKSRSEISETLGVAEAVAWVRKTKETVSLNLMKELHKIIFKNSKVFAGKFRGKGIEVGVVDSSGKVVHRGTPSEQVVTQLRRLVGWYVANKRRYPPIILASVVHNRFERIHPFQDGNGRIGRLLLINVLIKHGLPPVNIELRNRKQYYASLKAYEDRGDIRPTIELILKEYERLKGIID